LDGLFTFGYPDSNCSAEQYLSRCGTVLFGGQLNRIDEQHLTAN